MPRTSRAAHWDNVYATKSENEVSWFQENPAPSLDLFAKAGATPASSIIDIGGGASRLVDCLIDQGFRHVTVLDLSETALTVTKLRLGERATRIHWIAADVTNWEPSESYDLWHDRAAFHFLTEAHDRAAYVVRLKRALKQGGHAIIASFALTGPERCSGLPVMRYDGEGLSDALGDAFELIATEPHDHVTPWGSTQHFQFSLFRRRPDLAAQGQR